MRVLVTGGAGFIGGRTVRQLLESGHDVVCLVRPTTDLARLQGLPITLVHGDVRDGPSVTRAAQTCQAVVHLASPSAWCDHRAPAMRDTNVRGTRHVLEAAAAVRARVVVASSVAAVGCSARPTVFDETAQFVPDAEEMPYASAKVEAEGLCRDAAARGVDVTVVNPGEVYGPGDTGLVTASTLVDFLRAWPVLVCEGGVGVVHVDDVALGIARALERGRRGERYILAGENVTIRALATLTLAAAKRRAAVVAVPRAPLRWAARIGPRFGMRLPFQPNAIPYATRYWFVSAAKARCELGVAFRSARDTIESATAWLQHAGYVS